MEVMRDLVPVWKPSLLPHIPADSSTYATFLFNAFDTNHDGSVSFEVSWGRWAREPYFLVAPGQTQRKGWVMGM